MESFRNACNRYASVMHSSGMRHLQISFCQRNRIPLGCILLCDIYRHFASAMLHFASLISHNLRCIPAYTHQIPTGFFQSLNNHRDNLYIISKKIGVNRVKMDKIGVFPHTHPTHTYTQSRRLLHWAISVIDVIYKRTYINADALRRSRRCRCGCGDRARVRESYRRCR